MKVYLAGKITKHGWRKKITGMIDDEDTIDYVNQHNQWPVYSKVVLGGHDYTGPYFTRCDHGCYHGNTDHGVGLSEDGCGSGSPSPYSRTSVLNLCSQAIHESDLIFAWIDREDIYGTLAELGYAHALRKRIWIASPAKFEELWMVYEMASKIIINDAPDIAFQKLLNSR